MKYEEQYASYKERTEIALEALLSADCGIPEPLLSAMRYSVQSGGKRLRPVMLLAACDAVGGDTAQAVPFACAIELVHTYSLVHDDMPAMDDDDMRRGRPTCHVEFGEGMALLAGDGLLSLAMDIMLHAGDTKQHIAAMREITRGMGVLGMVAGQCMDLTCEANRSGDADALHYIHLHKTADLFIASVCAGLALGGASEIQIKAGRDFAMHLGRSFQMWDDVLDDQGDEAVLGKRTGQDAKHGKLTGVSVYGKAEAIERANALMQRALSSLASIENSGFLKETATRLLMRDH